MTRHANISVFVPHIGCRHRCSFCNQNTITGVHKAPSPDDIDDAVKAAKKSAHYQPDATQIAFFGGSFTAIPRDYMISLLSRAKLYVDSGEVSGIRLSTRPDAVDDDIMELMLKYSVTDIELGAQSMADSVLKMNERGHTAEDVRRASGLIKACGIGLGLQMMTGLYGDTDDLCLYTAQELIKLRPDTVRIYPAIVLRGTALEELLNSGKYRPQSLDEAVELCCRLIEMFQSAGVSVIRTGLHTVPQDEYLAGPWHPAFRELCDSRRYFNIALEQLCGGGDYLLEVANSAVSKMIGQNKRNVEVLRKMGYNCLVKANPDLKEYEVKVIRLKDVNPLNALKNDRNTRL